MRPELPRVLTSAECPNVGITPAQARTELRRGRWRRLAAGVFLTRPERPDRNDWLHVGLALTAGSGAVTGWDVVHARGLAPRRPAHPLVVLITPDGRNRVVGGVHLRPSRRPSLVTRLSASHPDLPRVPVVSTARAIADTALFANSLAPVRAMVTAAVQRGLCRPDDLMAELESGPRGGSYFFRLALADLHTGAASIAEAEAIELLNDRGLQPFEVNVAILDDAGRVVAVADALWRELRAILEVDSREFHFDEISWKRTMRRHNQLARLGYAVAHYPPSEIRTRRELWADEVATWLTARARELALPRQ